MATPVDVGPAEVERLNPAVDTVQVGDRLRLFVQLPIGSPEYLRELIFTAFPFLGTPGAYLDLGEYLAADTSTAALDYATGMMSIEADVVREASPGVLLLIVVTAAVVALAAIFPSATVTIVERLSRAAGTIAGGAGQVAGSLAGGAVGGVAKGLGISTPLLLLLVGVGVVAFTPFGAAAIETGRAASKAFRG